MTNVSPMLLEFLQLNHAEASTALRNGWAVDSTTGLVNSSVRRIVRDMTAATTGLPPTVPALRSANAQSGANSGAQSGAAAEAPSVLNLAEANVILNRAGANRPSPSDTSPKKVMKVICGP